jgi:hypothetical protein
MEVGFVGSPVVLADDAPPRRVDDVPMSLLERRVRSARWRWLAATSAAVVVVVATSLALTGSGGGPHHRHVSLGATSVRQLRSFPNPPLDFANGVTAGGGYIWTIENQQTKPGSISYVFRRDAATGSVLSRYQVPEQDDHIAFGLGRVWVWSDNDDFATTAVATVDVAGDVDIEKTKPPIAIHSATFTKDAAWFTEPGVNSVRRLGLVQGAIYANTKSTITGARFVVPVGVSTVLVEGRSATAHVLPGGHPVSLQGPTAPTLLASAPSYGFWVAHGKRLSYQAGVNAAPSLVLTFSVAVGAVVGDPQDGVYVALRINNPPGNIPYLAYYSPADLAAGARQPTASLHGVLLAETLVANPSGGVVFTTNNGTVDAWRPAGSSTS